MCLNSSSDPVIQDKNYKVKGKNCLRNFFLRNLFLRILPKSVIYPQKYIPHKFLPLRYIVPIENVLIKAIWFVDWMIIILVII